MTSICLKSTYFFPGDMAALEEVGGKGLSLLEGGRASLPVPPGCILTFCFFDAWLSQLKTTTAWKKFLEAENGALADACEVLRQTAALQRFDADTLFAVRLVTT